MGVPVAISVSAQPNGQLSPRSASVQLSGLPLTINQSASPGTLTVSADRNWAYRGEQLQINAYLNGAIVPSNSAVTWSVTPTSQVSITADGRLTFDPACTTGCPTQATVTATSSTGVQAQIVIQSYGARPTQQVTITMPGVAGGVGADLEFRVRINKAADGHLRIGWYEPLQILFTKMPLTDPATVSEANACSLRVNPIADPSNPTAGMSFPLFLSRDTGGVAGSMEGPTSDAFPNGQCQLRSGFVVVQNTPGNNFIDFRFTLRFKEGFTGDLQILSRNSERGQCSPGPGCASYDWARAGNFSVMALAPPAVTIDEPAPGAALSGTATLRGWAIDNTARSESAISRVELWMEPAAGAAQPLGAASQTDRTDVCNAYPGRPGCPNVGWQRSWDTRFAANGTYTLRVVATDSDSSLGAGIGNKTATVTRTVTVNNPPLTTLAQPADGAINLPTSPVLQWNAVSGATGYDVYVGTLNPPVSVTATVTTTSYSTASLGLQIGEPYFWRVVAKKDGAAGNSSATWSFMIGNPTQRGTLLYRPITPCRAVDTRTDQNFPQGYGPPALAAYGSRAFILTGRCGLPATARAYALNVTALPSTQLDFLSIWPEGQDFPGVSTLNAPNANAVANLAIVPAGNNGAVSNGTVRVVAGMATNLIIDVYGYFDLASNLGADGLSFSPVAPCRAVDTAWPNGPQGGPHLAAWQGRAFTVAGLCGVPTNAQAFSLNASVQPSNGYLGFLTVWPNGEDFPVVSTLNAAGGQAQANAALVRAGAGGAVHAVGDAATRLMLDVDGYFGGTPNANGNLKFYPIRPCRVADTRTDQPFTGHFGPPSLGAGQTRSFLIPEGRCNIPSAARVYALNVTVVPQGPLARLTLWPTGQERPGTSTLNAANGRVVAAAALVGAGSDRAISVYAEGGATNVVLDINGYFAP